MLTPEELLDGALVFALPLKREFRGVTLREGLLFEGPSGWAEFAPFLDHPDTHAARWLEAAIEQAYGTWPEVVRDHVPVNAIIPVCDADTARAWTEDAIDRGCTTIKTKVGAARFDDDVARVAAIRAALDDASVHGTIRIDTNRHWSLEQAMERIPVLDAIAGGLEYVEQPVAAPDDLRELRRHIDVRIAVDEGIRLTEDPTGTAKGLREYADVAVLKSIPLGGVIPALEVAAAAGIPTVVSGSLDTAVGLASGLRLAASLPTLPFACGLGTGTLFRRDLVDLPPRVVDGHMALQREVPTDIDPFRLVDDDMRARWHAKVRRAWEHARIPGKR